MGYVGLRDALAGAAGVDPEAIDACALRTGDLGTAACQLLAARAAAGPPRPPGPGVPLLEARAAFEETAALRGPGRKAARMGALLHRASPLEAKYLVKIARGDLRIGLMQGLVEEALAHAFGARLAALPLEPPLFLSPAERIDARAPGAAAEVERRLEAARARGNEGLMIKDPAAAYHPGTRGRWWLKLKRAGATLDVVVVAVEHGHGRRAGVLSDYTFAVRNGDRLAPVGKAYSGLTDAEIAALTRRVLATTVSDHGALRVVEPTVVLEVAFDSVRRSDRHGGGYALRFPRILRIREDKTAGEIDSLETVARLCAGPEAER